MTSSSDVAIVLCTRERADLLRGALRAIRSHTPADVELVVVDSASTTAATISVAQDAGANVVRSDIKGLSIARNRGLHATQRDIVVYTDDDCEVTPGWIDVLLPHFSAGAGAVTGRLLDPRVDAGPPAPPRTLARVRDGLDAGHGAIMAFRRELLLELGGFDEVLGAGRRAAGAEDLDMFCRVIRSGAPLVHEPAFVARHIFTRDDQEFIALNSGYGIGLGAMWNKWVRFAPVDGLRLGMVMIVRGLTRAVRNVRDRRLRRGATALLRGIAVGFRESLGSRIEGQRFVDLAPPEPIVLKHSER